jgi:hypothetical protein
VKLGDFFVSLIRADGSLSDIEPERSASVDAYDLIDQVEPASWAKLAAWNAFVLQAYGDELVEAGTRGKHLMTDIEVFARRLYQHANVWLEEARKSQVSTSYRYRFVMPCPLPHWLDNYRTNEHIHGMHETLDTARTRAAFDLKSFEGEQAEREQLQVRLAQVDSELQYCGRLTAKKMSTEQRVFVGQQLTDALDHAYALGQLLAQPELMRHR